MARDRNLFARAFDAPMDRRERQARLYAERFEHAYGKPNRALTKR